MVDDDPTLRDDRAWRRGAVPLSLIIGLIAMAIGLVIVVSEPRPFVAGLGLAAGTVTGSALIVIAIRRWLTGGTFPAGLGLVATLAILACLLLSGVTRSRAGIAMLTGLFAGCTLANVWAVRAARANRPPPAS